MVQNWHQTHDWTLIGSGANGVAYCVHECTFYIVPSKLVNKIGKSLKPSSSSMEFKGDTTDAPPPQPYYYKCFADGTPFV